MDSQNPWKGLVLGAVGGAAGTLAMGYYFKAISHLPEVDIEADIRPLTDPLPHSLDNVSLVGTQYKAEEGSTAALGRIIYQALAHQEPDTQETKALLSQLVHWNFGMSMGSLYGMLRGQSSFPDIGGGMLFGSSVWLFGSEMMVPLLGLSPGPAASPVAQHAKEFGAHLVYGAVAAATTQLLQRIL